MTLGKHAVPEHSPDKREDSGPPPTNKALMAAAGVLLAIPVVALMWVPSYAREKPELWGFPFFFWYQLMWVFICSALTWTAYRLTLAARPRRGPGDGRRS